MQLKDKKIYVTTLKKSKLRNKFLNFRFYYFISVPDIIKELGEDPENLTDRGIFLVNNKIVEYIHNCLKRKKYMAIIYSNPDLNYEAIKNLQEKYAEHENILSISFLDYKNKPENVDLWQLFEEVIFFPEMTKKKIIECKSIQIEDI